MNRETIIRAWRDADFFFSLSEEERSTLPSNPVGMVELSQDALRNVRGLGDSWFSCDRSCHCETCYSGSCCCCC